MARRGHLGKLISVLRLTVGGSSGRRNTPAAQRLWTFFRVLQSELQSLKNRLLRTQVEAADFRQYDVPVPNYRDVAAKYEAITRSLDQASSSTEAITAVEKWDLLRRRLSTWVSLVNIRFNQDTRNEDYIRDREYCDELEPKLTNLAIS